MTGGQGRGVAHVARGNMTALKRDRFGPGGAWSPRAGPPDVRSSWGRRARTNSSRAFAQPEPRRCRRRRLASAASLAPGVAAGTGGATVVEGRRRRAVRRRQSSLGDAVASHRRRDPERTASGGMKRPISEKGRGPSRSCLRAICMSSERRGTPARPDAGPWARKPQVPTRTKAPCHRSSSAPCRLAAARLAAPAARARRLRASAGGAAARSVVLVGAHLVGVRPRPLLRSRPGLHRLDVAS